MSTITSPLRALPLGALLAASLLFVWSPTRAAAAQPTVAMVIENRGTITIELEPQAAPKTVAHFLSLVDKHFYDGILFHRVIPNFVAQAGDPKSKKVDGAKLRDIPSEQVGPMFGLGNGGSGTTVPLEVKMAHERGTLGLARTNDPNTGDSQFFFNLVTNASLSPNPQSAGYCVFGKVVKGLDVMDKIQQGDRIKSIHVVTAAKKK